MNFYVKKSCDFAWFLKYFPYDYPLPVNLSIGCSIAILANHLIASIHYLY